MWIEAHFINSGDTVYVQMRNIAAVYPYQGDGVYKGQTVIQFSGDDDNYIRVRETVDEILSQIVNCGWNNANIHCME